MKTGILLAGMASALALSAGAARASVVFNFNGVCAACSLGGVGGQLSLTNGYVFGTDITSATFQFFSYQSSSGNFVISIPTTFQGGLNANGSLSGSTLEFGVGPFDFSDHGATAQAKENLVFTDNISFAQFTLVPTPAPEPATWATMILGLAAVGGVLRRRRGKGQALA